MADLCILPMLAVQDFGVDVTDEDSVGMVCLTVLTSDVLAWLGLEATGFGLALDGFGFWNSQAKP